MYNYLILSQLQKHAKGNRAFHVPGHKAAGDFKVKFPVAHLDVTELSYSDNLQCPTGVIAQAQADIAAVLGAKKSYILTDGSTLGVFASVYAVCRRGDKLIVPRTAHTSVWNACRVLGVEPVIVQGECRENVIAPPDPALIEKLIANDRTIVAMLVASPDYYGNFAPLKEYSALLKSYGRTLIVDGAHGAHLAFEPSRAGYAGNYADIWVDGAHKTLPTLTQGAVLSVNDESLIAGAEEGLSIFRTTSPSYPIMASVEYGVKYVANNPVRLAKAKEAVAEFRKKASLFTLYPSDDWTKIVVDFKPLNVSSDKAAKILEKKGIYPELSDGRYLLFYVSPSVGTGELNALRNALNTVAQNKKLKNTYKELPLLPPAPRTYSYGYALSRPWEYIPLAQSVGRMCAGNAGLTPPCIPVTVAGEIISEAAAKALAEAKNTFGLKDGMIKVVKK